MLSTSVASAEIIRSPEEWSVKPDFGKSSEAREALSGAACVGSTNHCLAVNDEKKYAQFFDLEERTIVPGEIVRLLPDKVDGQKMKEIDAEGVAYAPARGGDSQAYLYVTGSHGLSRSGKLQASRFMLFRIPVDGETGRPTFTVDGDKPAPEIERTALLRETIRNTDGLEAQAEQPLDRNGVTIEGIAVEGDSLLLGLRSPCLAEQALILHVAVGGLFQDAAPTGAISRLALGDNVGIRDLAKVGDGLLILAGRSDDARGDQTLTCGEERVPPAPLPSIWFWSGKEGGAAENLGRLPGVTAGDSAETLLVLSEADGAYRVLVLFDGTANGDPAEFTVRR